MKKIFLVFAITILFTSCEKEEVEVEIPLADQIMGNYTINLFKTEAGSIALPFTNSEGEVLSSRAVLTKTSDTSIDFNVITGRVISGITFSEPSISRGLLLTKNDAGAIEIKQSTSSTKFAEVNGSNLTIFGTSNGEAFTYEGTKDL